MRTALVGVITGLAMVLAAAVWAQDQRAEHSIVIFNGGQETRGEILPPIPGEEIVRLSDGSLGSRPIGSDRPGTPLRGGTITVRSADGMRISYPMSVIQEVILPQEQDAETADSLVGQIRRGPYMRGDLLGALEQTSQALALNPNDPEIREFAFTVATDIYREAQGLTEAGDYDRAFQFWDALLNHLSVPGASLQNPAPRPGEVPDLSAAFEQDYRSALRNRVANYMDRADQPSTTNRTALLEQAWQTNQRLLGRSGQTDFYALVNRIDIAQMLGESQMALQYAQELSDQLDAGQIPGVDRTARSFVDLKLNELQGGGSTARPAPQPAPNGISQILSQVSQPPPANQRPRPAVQSTPQMSTWDELRLAFRRMEWGRIASILGGSLGSDQPLVVLAVIIIGAWLFLWFAPHKFAQSRARGGSILASVWAPRIKLWGPFGAIGWMIAAVMPKRALEEGEDGIKIKKKKKKKKRGKGAEHPCPSCSGELGQVDLYRDMQFHACPHCAQPITPIYNINDYISFLVKRVDAGRGGKVIDEEALKDTNQRESMLKLVRAVITHAVRSRASDIHIEATGDGLDVRARIDGLMTPLNVHITKAVERAFISATKVMADLDITERRAPQDGRFEMKIDAVPIDFRVNTSPTGLGERVTMRVLDIRSVHVPMENLGFSEENLQDFRSVISAPHGMLLVTGPTGSGKSTTLYVALNTINDGTRNIVTLEDPIEFIFRGLNQHQVNPAANFTFANGLRSIIRSDPDVIMVGEIRDNETAVIAVDAATTGHLVMSTLHTIDAAGAYQRLLELGVSSRRFAPSLLMVLAQRLARLTCDRCRSPYTPDPQAMAALRITEEETAGIEWRRGTGCEVCQNLGYRGRVGIFEVMKVQDEIEAMMEEGVTTAALRAKAREQGMRTLREEGIRRVMEGITTPEEVHRVIS